MVGRDVRHRLDLKGASVRCEALDFGSAPSFWFRKEELGRRAVEMVNGMYFPQQHLMGIPLFQFVSCKEESS